MIRLSSLIVCASILACAMSQTNTTTTTGPQPTPTPTPTTGPPVTESPPANDYIFKVDGKTCVRMKANITVKFEYKNKTSGQPLDYKFTLVGAGAHVDETQSICPTKLVLIYNPTGDEADPNSIIFTFMQTSDDKAWTSETVQYNFIVTKEEFHDIDPNYIGLHLSYNATNKLLDGNVDLEGSYKCNANEDIQFDSSSTNNSLNVVLEVVELQVQAYFKEGKDEDFGTVQECAADSSKGNKIVPIAVGAALAGLVIVVLIAYLIGRLKSRRQSSYEALS